VHWGFLQTGWGGFGTYWEMAWEVQHRIHHLHHHLHLHLQLAPNLGGLAAEREWG